MGQKPTNQGEGDRESAKRYNRNTPEYLEGRMSIEEAYEKKLHERQQDVRDYLAKSRFV